MPTRVMEPGSLFRPALQKPAQSRIWYPSRVPIPDMAFLMLPQEVGSGTLWDWRSSDLAAQPVNFPGWSNGMRGPARTFDTASAQRVTFSSSAVQTLPVTVSVIFKATSLAQDNCLIGSTIGPTLYYAGWWVLAQASGNIRLNYGDGVNSLSGNRRSGASGDTITVGTWYHIVGIIRSALDMSIWINGKHQTITYSGTGGNVVWSPGTGTMGLIYAAGVNTYASQEIATAMVWRGALTAAEVAAHYADPYMWLREPIRAWMPSAAAGTGNPWYAYAQQ